MLSANGILEVAQEGEHPRSYEVAGQILKNMSELNSQLLDLQKSMAELEYIENPDYFSRGENIIEYYYRMGRVFKKIEKPQKETIVFFEKAVTTGRNSNTYYAPMSALQIAIEYDKMGEKQNAPFCF